LLRDAASLARKGADRVYLTFRARLNFWMEEGFFGAGLVSTDRDRAYESNEWRCGL
jgi:hypothetical protein